MAIYNSPRRKAWRNMLVATINAGLEQKLFGLEPDENFWPGATSGPRNAGSYVFNYKIRGIPAIVRVSDLGGGELSFCVSYWPRFQIQNMCRSSKGLRFGDAYAYGVLERAGGKFLKYASGDSIIFSARLEKLDEVAALEVEPRGFSDHGRLYARGKLAV